MKTSTRSWWGRLDAVLVLAAFLGVAASPANAQPAGGGDPPSRAARVSDLAGQVWIYSDDTGEWVTVDRNRPLTTGDRIATDNGARAEITLGSTTLRLDAATEIEVAQLDDSRYVVHLAKGSLAARLRSPQSLSEFEVDTDDGGFRVQTVGRYRIDRFEQGSDLTVYNGQASYEAKNTALPVYTGQHAQFWVDNAGVPQYAMVAPTRDGFFAWNDDRDRSEDRVASTRDRFVSPEMTGADDLARYGRWQESPDDGPLWVPTSVPVDWAPYSAGHWAFIRPWGWTWVDDAPWGFAPFHYGRWVYRSNVWCWAPGTYVARPVYAPALVAWIGGPRVGLTVSVGGPPVGWFPLGPREVYVPSYRASPRYVREVNITHVTNITNITTIVNNRNGEADRRDFANRGSPHAVTFVPSDVMTRREPVGPAAARFRSDPQWRSFVAENRPAPALSVAPVAAPAAPQRPAGGSQPPRPPFEGRGPGGPSVGSPSGPGGFAGRPEGPRPDVGRSALPPGAAQQNGSPRNEAIGRGGPPPVGLSPGRGARDGSSPAVAAPAVRDAAPPAAAVAPVPQRIAPPTEAQPPRMKIPAPVRGMQPAEAGRVAPAMRGREGEAGNAVPQSAQPQPAPAQAAPRAAEPPRARGEERRDERRDDKAEKR